MTHVATHQESTKSIANVFERQRKVLEGFAECRVLHEADERRITTSADCEIETTRRSFEFAHRSMEELWNELQQLESNTQQSLQHAGLGELWPAPSLEISPAKDVEAGLPSCVKRVQQRLGELENCVRELKSWRIKRKNELVQYLEPKEINLEEIKRPFALTNEDATALADKWSFWRRWHLWPLSQHAVIKRVDNMGQLHARFFCLTEERKLDYKEVPGLIHDRAKSQDFSNEAMWGVRFDVPKDYSQKTLCWQAPQPDSIRTCPRCGGSGRTDCWRCRGTGEVMNACSMCSRGKGVDGSRCIFCDGKGKRKEICSVCGGQRRVECASCEGLGALLRYPVVTIRFLASEHLVTLKRGKQLHDKAVREMIEAAPCNWTKPASGECFAPSLKLPLQSGEICLLQRAEMESGSEAQFQPQLGEMPPYLDIREQRIVAEAYEAFLAQQSGRIRRVGMVLAWRPEAICQWEGKGLSFLLFFDATKQIKASAGVPHNSKFWIALAIGHLGMILLMNMNSPPVGFKVFLGLAIGAAVYWGILQPPKPQSDRTGNESSAAN